MKKIFVIAATIILFSPVSVYAKTAQSLFDENLNITAKETGHAGAGAPLDSMTAPQVISLVINALLSILGIAFLVLMIYGGFIWMTARGNDKDVEKAKSIIINSIIGLAIVLSAYVITIFVGKRLIQ